MAYRLTVMTRQELRLNPALVPAEEAACGCVRDASGIADLENFLAESPFKTVCVRVLPGADTYAVMEAVSRAFSFSDLSIFVILETGGYHD